MRPDFGSNFGKNWVNVKKRLLKVWVKIANFAE